MAMAMFVPSIILRIPPKVMLFLWVHICIFSYIPHASGLSVTPHSSTTSSSSGGGSSTGFSWGKKRVLVVGGAGRVGGSVVTELVLQQGADVVVGGTQQESFERTKARWKANFSKENFAVLEDQVSFVKVDKEEPSTISKVLEEEYNFDLVVHTAGPFQGKVKATNGVLEAAVHCGVPYVDVCDDYCTASAAKTKYATLAKENNVPCIISTGCWPGVSSLMAKQLSTHILSRNKNLSPSDLNVNFSFFTAGSGGAGSTLLVATFLILAEQALKVVNGRRTEIPPMREYSNVNFGPIVGDKQVAHLNLLETASVHDVLGINNVQSLFGTAPGFWNSLLGVMAQLPSSLLSNEPIMEKLAIFSLPIVRLVDMYAGATNAMRCDVTYNDKTNENKLITETALYAHENLEPCVGQCVVAFCDAILSSDSTVPSGVWFPEEAINAPDDVRRVLELSSRTAHTTIVNSSTGTIDASEVWGKSAIPLPT